jgi:hypothetical protein
MTHDLEVPLEVRAAFTAGPGDEPPLRLTADRVLAAGRARRRRRWATGASAVAVVAVLGIAGALVAGTTGPTVPARPPAPAGTITPQPGPCGIPRFDIPTVPQARGPADLTWPYRGDPALRTRAEQILRGVPGGERVLEVRPLFGGGMPGGGQVVLAAVRERDIGGTGWTYWFGSSGRRDAGGGGGGVAMPALTPTTQLSSLTRIPFRGQLPTGAGIMEKQLEQKSNVLTVVGPPGSDSIDFEGCYRGQRFTVSGRGDHLVADVGPLDAPGRITVRRDGRVVYAGDPATYADPSGGIAVPSIAGPVALPIMVPQGFFKLRGQGQETSARTGDEAASYSHATVNEWPSAQVLVRCQGDEPASRSINVTAGAVRTTVPCDGRVHVAATVSVGPGFQATAGQAGDPSVRLIVIAPS